jgi:AbrB family looped-hinge helix DNA binding protein
MADADVTHTATVSSKGQVTIPAALRRGFGLEKGDRIRFIEGPDGKVYLVPVTRALSALAGRFADAPVRQGEPDPLGEALAEDDARIRGGAAADHAA